MPPRDTSGQAAQGSGGGNRRKGGSKRSTPQPRLSGVFADGSPLGDPIRKQVHQARAKVRQAEEKVPGRSLNIGRLPHGSLTRQTRAALVAHQENVIKREIAHAGGVNSHDELLAGKGNHRAAGDRAQSIHLLEGLGDKATRQALHQLSGAQETGHHLKLANDFIKSLPFDESSVQRGGAQDWIWNRAPRGKPPTTHDLNVLGTALERGGADAPPPGMDAGKYKGTSKRASEESTASTMGIPDTPVLSGLANAAGAVVHTASKVAPYAMAAPLALAPGGVGTVTKNVFKDAGDMMIGAVPSLFGLGKIGADVVSGNGKGMDEINALAQGLKDESFVGNVAQGRFSKAGHIAHDHPLMSALEFSGAEAAVGRSLGTAARAFSKEGPLGGVARAASTKRAPTKLLGDVAEIRHYDPDPLRKGLQRLGEAVKGKVREHRYAEGDFRRDPTQATGRALDRKLTRRTSGTASANEVIRREGREAMRTIMRKVEPATSGLRQRFGQLGKHSDILGLITQGMVRGPKTLIEDLSKYHGQIEAKLHADAKLPAKHAGKMTPAERRSNQAMQDSLANALEDQKFLDDPTPWFQAADAYTKQRNRIDEDLTAHGLLTQEQVTAKLIPALQVHENVKFVHAGKSLGPEGDAALESWQSAHMVANAAERNGTDQALVGALRDREGGLRQHIIDEHGVDPEGLGAGWVTPDGLKVDIERATQLLEKNGLKPGEMGFLSHRPDERGRGAYMIPSHKRPQRETHHREGVMVAEGTFAAHWRAMTDDIQNAFGRLIAAKNFDRTAGEFAVAPSGTPTIGGPRAWQRAQQLQREMGDQGIDVRPMRLTPMRERADIVQGIIDEFEGSGALPQAGAIKELEAMLQQAEIAGDGPVVLMPGVVIDAWKDLATGGKRIPGSAGTVMRFLTQNFKSTVLPLSPKWFVANHVEGITRSIIHGHGPVDWLRGFRYGEALERHDAAHGTELHPQFRARAFLGRLFGSHRHNVIYMDRHDVEGTWLAVPVALAHKARMLGAGPVRLDTFLGLFNKLAEGSFRLNDFLERQYVTAAVGAKVKKDLREMADANWKAVRITSDALGEYIANGHVNPDTFSDMEKYLDDSLGRYGRHTPGERALVQHFFPFLDWYRNALKFTLITLPVHHPVKTGMLAAYEQIQHDDLQQQGQVMGSDVPDYLRGNPREGDSFLPLGHMLPWSAASDFPKNLPGLALPQWKGLYDTLGGQSWKHTPLRDHNGNKITDPVELFLLALYKELEPQVKGLNQTRRILEKGGSSTDDSTVLAPHVKQDTGRKGTLNVLDKVFNPFHPYQSSGGKGGAPSLRDELLGGAAGAKSLRKDLGIENDVKALRKQLLGG